LGGRERLLQTTADNEGVTEIIEIKGRGHALTIDSGWREVADTALAFVKRFTPPTG
jgi:non-heme chloroperoxidase